MSNSTKMLDFATGVIAVCAVVVTVLFVKRELSPVPLAAAGVQVTQQADWQTFATSGRILGDPQAPVTIVEFADFECTFCKRFHIYADSLARLGYAFKVVYRHFPLPGNRFAVPAARASECAAAQGRFREMHDALYSHADSFGLASWTWFARTAGVSDTTSYERCMTSTQPLLALEQDTLAARRLGITGTPLLLIGETRVNGVPPFDSLRAYLERAAEDVKR